MFHVQRMSTSSGCSPGGMECTIVPLEAMIVLEDATLADDVMETDPTGRYVWVRDPRAPELLERRYRLRARR